MLLDSRRVFLNTQKIEQAKESFCWLGWESPFSLLLTMFEKHEDILSFSVTGKGTCTLIKGHAIIEGSMRVFSRFLRLKHAVDSRTVSTATQA